MYVDPNTGGVIAQFLMAAAGVIMTVMLVFSRKIREGIARLRRGARKEEDESTKE